MKSQTILMAMVVGVAMVGSTYAQTSAGTSSTGSTSTGTAAGANLSTGSAAKTNLNKGSAAHSRLNDPRAATGNVTSSQRRNTDTSVRSGATYRDSAMDNQSTGTGSSVRAGMNTRAGNTGVNAGAHGSGSMR